jgi:hypothetical protein
LTISVNCGIILSKAISLAFSIISTVIPSLVTSVVSFVTYPVDRLMYAADRIRSVTVTKFRTIFITKDLEV